MEMFAAMSEAVAVRGVVAVLLGLVAFFLPGLTLEILLLCFGFYAILDAIFAFMAWLKTKMGGLLVEAVIGVLCGLFILFWPTVAVTIFVYLVAVWALLTGIAEIAVASALRKSVAKEIFLLLAGVVSIIFAVLLFMKPMLGAITLVWLIGAYAIVFGVILLVLSFKLRKV